MKKEYHYTISRTDRIYLISFVMILLGWELIKLIIPSGEKSFTYVSPPSKHKGFKEKKEFTSSTKYHSNNYEGNSPFQGAGGKQESISPFHGAEGKSEFNNSKQYSSYQEEQEQSSPMAPLSIQTASLDELISMGLSRKVAFNIQKFVSNGGTITKAEDLMRMYGMDSLQLNNALPYIIFGTLPDTEGKKEFPEKNELKTIDLNQASQEDLESLNGIGTYSAERIIKFRNEIGGFISSEQLKDCSCLYPDTYEKIKDQLTVSGTPQPLLINQVNLDSIHNPYLNKKMIRLIKAYKKQHGDFQNETDFRKVYPPDSNWCNKILPYLSFENKD